MAQITGSSTIDWSTIPLGQLDFAAHIVHVSIRSEEISNELENPANYTIVSQTPTLLVVDLVSGGRLRLAGTGMDNFPSFINSLTEFDFTNIATGEVIRYTGLFDGIGNELITSATFGSTGYLEKVNGNVTVFQNDTFSGTATSLTAVIGSNTVTFSGNFRITGNDVVASLTGTVTGISVVSGADTINMTGLSLSIDVVEAALMSGQLATVNDLFSVVGSQMTGNDTITYSNNSGTGMTFFGGAGNDTITISGPNADTLNGGAGNDTLNGRDGNDTLTGLAGNDTLNGGAGNDVLDGGVGNDTYVVDSANDTVTESLAGTAGGTDIVQSSAANFTLGANVENLTLTDTDNLNGTGNVLNNILIGNSGNNILSGGDGNDKLTGLAGNDTLNGGTGNDSMIGGVGDDTYVVDIALDVVTETLTAAAGGGNDTVQSSAASFTLGANVENLTLTGAGDLNGTGNASANTLIGNSGNNQLSGGLGEDTVNGGAGNDQIIMLVTAGNVDTIDAGTGTDTLVLSGVVPGNHVLEVNLASTTDQVVSIGGVAEGLTQTNFENLNATGIGSVVNVTGSTGDNNIIGSKGNDSMDGGAGNDTLDGGAGNDSMTGGVGNDTYTIDSLGDSITELDGEGTDTININRSVDLTQSTPTDFTEIENVVLTGTAAINATGNGGNNLLTGNSAANILNGGDGADTLTGLAGNDTLNGGAGNDTMDGGAGNDTYVVDSANDTVTESLAGAAGGIDLVQSSAANFTLGTNVENLTLTGTDNLNGTGNVLNNILTGNSGNNSLSGGEGTDTLTGLAGNDTLNGGTGNDSMIGGVGDDTYVVDSALDVVTETLTAAAGGGNDTVQSSAASFTLGANVENVTLTGTGDLNGTGNAFANTLTGNSGNNQFSGGLGEDIVIGGAGNDQITMLVTAGNVDTIDAGTGTDTLILSGVVPGNHVVRVNLASTTDQVVSIGGVADALTQINFENLDASGIGSAVNVTTGSAGNNSIIGSKGDDWLVSGAGDDTLNGGLGCDTMIGGLGNDTYVINDLDDSVTELPDEGTDTVNINRSVDLNDVLFSGIENVLLTGIAAINATGNGGNNLLTGNSAANILNGGDGNDTLTGNAGNDTLLGGNGDDTLNGGEGNDTYRYDTIFSSPGNDAITDSGGNDLIAINSFDFSGLNFEQTGNNFVGSAFGDSVTIVDQYAGPASKVESLQFESSSSILGVTVGGASLFGYALGSAPYLLNTDAGHAGGLQNDLIAGSIAGGETLTGNGGNDLLFGNGGADGLNGGAGNDLLVGGDGADTLNGDDGNDTLVGGSGQDTVNGGAGDDHIGMDITDGDVDTLDAGTGNDTLVLSGLVFGGISDVVEVNLASTTDQVVSIGGATDAPTQINFENLDASGLFLNSVVVTGSGGANIITGSQGDDTLNGGDGNDTYRYDTTSFFGSGNDAITDSGGNDLIAINGFGFSGLNFEQIGNNLIGSVFSSVFGSSVITVVDQYAGPTNKVESLQFESSSSILGVTGGGASVFGYALGSAPYLLNTDPGHTGGLQNDLIAGSSPDSETLTGGGGNDLLFGNGGDDTLNGGVGNDLLVDGDGADTLDGGDGNDTLVGGSGQDTVTGGAGDDHIGMEVTPVDVDEAHGGVGTDTLVLIGGDPLTGVVEVDLSVADQVVSIGGVADAQLQDGFENLDASGLGSSVNATGSAGANSIIGSSGNDIIEGGAGNDTLDGGAGDDTISGGLGDDTYTVDSDGDEVIEDPNAGTDKVFSSINYTLTDNVENLELIGIADLSGTGNALNNILTGNSGNNSLDGGTGADKMAGGLGNDSYTVDVAGDVVTEALNAGTDTVFTSLNYTLGANVDNLELTGSDNLKGTGNTLNNVLTGNSGNNFLSGLAGNDTLRGEDGNDTVNGGSGNDTFLFGSGDGQDLIQDNSGCMDKIFFDGGINPLDLVISRQANNLQLAIHGSSDQITVQNWFVGTANRMETIQAGDGQVLLSTQVDQLIQAMAQFTTDTGLSWDQGIDQQPAQVQGIIAANWQ